MRPAVDLDLPLALDPDGGEPLHRQLATQLAAAVRAGRLRRDARLPASRTLAGRLGISRGVVLAAYEELTAQGFLEGRHGSGTYVAATLPAVLPVPRRPAPRRPDADPGARVADLRPGMPDARRLPDAAWRRAWWRARTMLAVDDEGRPPGGGGGSAALRSALAGYLLTARGLAVDPSEITVTAGSREALALLALAIGVAGRDVVVEEPGYPRAVALFRRLGARIVPVPVDDQGLRTDLLPRPADARDVAAVHVTPSHQYPLGGVLPLHRRAAHSGAAASGGRRGVGIEWARSGRGTGSGMTDMSEPRALPVPDYDHLTVGDLAHRIRSLDAQALETLLAYEREHGDRLPVVQTLSARLEQVRTGAPPSDGDASAPSPHAPPPADAGSPVQPATAGPTINPPSHGVPTNPAQPRSTG